MTRFYKIGLADSVTATASAMARAAIESAHAARRESVLNWDGTVPSRVDMLDNVRYAVSAYTGFALLRVEMHGDMLEVARRSADGWTEQLLVYKMSRTPDGGIAGREIYGRLANVGLASVAHELGHLLLDSSH